MNRVELTDVSKSYDGVVRALDGVTLEVREGELLAILGPSGCGKTTLLRALAGLERIDSGEIVLAGGRVAGRGVHVPAHRRRAALVPQDPSLFPHLTVAANVGFGLSRVGARARVAEVLDLVGLTGLGDRMPHELSGGQQQRVSVARALAPRPALVLLDEPFSALDAALRSSLRAQVKEALAADGATGVLVTHDQAEALAMADRIAVLRDGHLLQVGTPHEVYHAPASEWVAHFVGEANIWRLAECTAPDRTPTLAGTPLGQVPVTPRGGATSVLVRPEQVLLGREGVPAHVRGVDFHGHDALVALDLADGTPVLARVATHAPVPTVGSDVHLRLSGWGHLLTGP